MNMLLNDPIEFIKLLKSQHKEILATIRDIDSQEGGAQNLEGSVEKLHKITEVLFDHLEKEDKKLYPTLLSHKYSCDLAKKYFSDMEHLSTIAVDFYKRYCVNREGLKILVEDFVNSYSLFKGLLKVRIKREEIELYPSFLLLHTGDINTVYETKNTDKQKTVIVFGQNQLGLEALTLALEICGYQVISTRLTKQVTILEHQLHPDLILLDVSRVDTEVCDLVIHLKGEIPKGEQLVGYSTTSTRKLDEKLEKNLDAFIPNAASDMEKFSEKIQQLLTLSK